MIYAGSLGTFRGPKGAKAFEDTGGKEGFWGVEGIVRNGT